MSKIDLSSNLQIVPYSHGVKVTRARSGFLYPTIADVMNFPCNVYFMNRDSECLKINEISAETSGYQSTRDAEGTTVFKVYTRENAKLITNVDKQVIRENRKQIREDMTVRKDDVISNYLTVKAPLYDQDDNIAGIFGCSVLLDQQPLAQSIALLAQTGLLNNAFCLALKNPSNLTPREKMVIEFLIRGHTAKEIGAKLYLSRRTIEHYIENIKTKMRVKTKSELIDKFYSDFSND